MKTIQPKLIRTVGDSEIYLVKEFKGSRLPHLTLHYCKLRNYAFLAFEDEWFVSKITFYDNISQIYGWDYLLSKVQFNYLKYKADTLRAIKESYISK